MKIVNGASIKNLPWEDKPDTCKEPVWRSNLNPILTRDDVYHSNSVFNSAIVPFEDGFAGIFRSDDITRTPSIYVGRSSDGINWDIEDHPIKFANVIEDMCEFRAGYDPRVCKIDDKYYITWCNMYKYFPTIGVAYTTDFKSFYQMENAFLPYNRNGILFPRKINGNYAMLSRPSDNGHTPFGDIFYSESPDLTYWGKHRHVMGRTGGWQSTKVGVGPVPIETDEGWLVIYHGVRTSCNGMEYSAGCAILDLERPWEVKYRTKAYILAPRELYEKVGDVNNVVFPCTAMCDADTGRISIYYGAADTVIGLAFTTVDELVNFTKENSL